MIYFSHDLEPGNLGKKCTCPLNHMLKEKNPVKQIDWHSITQHAYIGLRLIDACWSLVGHFGKIALNCFGFHTPLGLKIFAFNVSRKALRKHEIDKALFTFNDDWMMFDLCRKSFKRHFLASRLKRHRQMSYWKNKNSCGTLYLCVCHLMKDFLFWMFLWVRYVFILSFC